MTNILVAFFSHTGNTAVIAQYIQLHSGGDLCNIETVQSYPTDYNAVVNQARLEQDADTRPALTTVVGNMASYAVVFIGFPNWWNTFPMAVCTFLDTYDLSGKTLIPFCTHEGSGIGRSVSDLRRRCPDATVLEGMAIRGSSVKSAGHSVSAWLDRLALR